MNKNIFLLVLCFTIQSIATVEDKLEMLSAQLKTLKIEFNLRLDKIESELILLKVKRSSQHRDVATRLAHTNPTKTEHYSLAREIALSDMTSKGFQIVYDYPYSHVSTYLELMQIKSDCMQNSILCVAGGEVESSHLLLVSCGNCLTILSETHLNEPKFENGAYWYLTKQTSFGFSDIYEIDQNRCDYYDCALGCTNMYKLCWLVNSIFGGWRLGKQFDLYNSSFYRKLIFLKKE